MSETTTIDSKCKNGLPHKWKTFKQTITSDNPLYEYGVAYFIVKGCEVCKKKLFIDYKVEKN